MFDGKAERLQVQGLSEEGRIEFVRRFFADTEEVAEIQEHMEETMGFGPFARLPGFCWTQCSVYQAAREAKQGLPKTLTSVFVSATASISQRHTLEMKQVATVLSGLGKMADRVILGETDYCLQVEMTSFGLQPFLTSPLLRDFLRISEHSFSFLSPTLAQFLLAVAYHRGSWDGNLADLMKLAVTKAPLLELFLAGLCDPSQRAPLEGLVGKFDSSRAQEFRAWLRDITQEVVPSYDRKRHLRCFRLLHQCQDSALVKAAIGPSTSLGMSYGGLSGQDAVALTYVVMSLGEMEQLNLYNSKNLSEEVMRHLVPVIGIVEKLILSQSTLTTGVLSPT
ncbi:hypothetical protein GJAV_G00191540 [Gymnothorax javanicus]|nr:hypothetical protein GJAV_G00191540 [Gymnothorax javanicus]